MSHFDVQLPEYYESLYSEDDLRYYINFGGRGSAKSTSQNIYGLFRPLIERKPIRILSLRAFQNSLQQSSKRSMEQLIQKYELNHFWNVNARTIKGADGSEIFYAGINRNPNNLRGLEEIDLVLIDEAQDISEESWQTLIPTVRKDGSKILATFNPFFPDDIVYKLFVNEQDNSPATVRRSKVIKSNYDVNPFFPTVLEEERLLCLEQQPHQYQHIWEGELVNMSEHAFFTPDMFKDIYVDKLPQLVAVIVGVDPATTSKEKSDETGIAVVGVGIDGIAYYIHDASGRFDAKSNKWAEKVVGIYRSSRALKLVCESNAGGDFLIGALNQVKGGRDINIELTPSIKGYGKYNRLEIAAGRFREGKVKFFGKKAECIRQLLTYDGEHERPDDRADALGIALWEIFAPRTKTTARFA